MKTAAATAALAIGVLLSGAWAAAAQMPPDARASIDRKAKMGDLLTVSTRDGARSKGRLSSAAADTLVLDDNGTLRSIRYDDIDRVRRRRNGMLLGAIIGLAAGIAGGIPLYMLAENETGDGAKDFVVAVMSGLGAGLAIDAALPSNRTIYRRPGRSASRLTLEPAMGGAVVRWSATW